MNWKEFEHQLRAGASQHESDIDTDRLWKAIKQKKRRKRALFWWFGGGIGALLIGGSALCYHHYSIQHSHISETDHLSTTYTTPISHPTAHQRTDTAQLVVSKHQVLPTMTVPQPLPRRGEKYNQGSNASNVSARSSGINNVEANGSNVSVLAKTAAGLSPSVSPILGLVTEQQTGTETMDHTAPLAAQQAGESANTQHGAANAAQQSLVTKPVQQSSLALLPMDTMSITVPREKPLLLTHPIAWSEKKKVTPPPKFYVEAQAAAAFWGGNRIGQIPFDTFVLSSQNRIVNLEAIRGDIAVSVPLSPAWSLRMGVGYARFNAVLKLDTSFVVPFTPASAIVQMANGTTVDTTVYYRTVRHRVVRDFNRVATFQVPITLSWTPRGWGRWACAPYAGVRLNLLQQAKGSLLDEENRLVSGPYAQQYKKSFGLTAEAGCQITWKYNNNLQFFLSPYGALDLSNRSTYSTNERFWQVGMGIGVRKAIR